MHTLVDRERDKYQDIWTVDQYAENSPGKTVLPLFLDMAGEVRGHSVLDAGCGSGKGAIALAGAGLTVRCCDLTGTGRVPEAQAFPFTEACLWDGGLASTIGGFVDWVYCCDVLEHIPTALTMLVVRNLLSLARRGVFLSITFEPDVCGVWIGQPLHQTVQPFVWWRDHLRAIGTVLEARDLLGAGVFLLRGSQC